MKNKNLFWGLAAIAAVSMSSCTNDIQEVQNTNGRTPITLTSNVNYSRTTNQNLQATQLAKDVKVGVFVKKAEGTDLVADNHPQTADGAGNFTGEAMYFPEDGSAVSVYAYAPYNSAWTGKLATAQTFTVQTDQSTDANYLASDLLRGVPAGTNSFTSENPKVALAFTHKLSKLNITLKTASKDDSSSEASTQADTEATETTVDLKGATVEILNTKPTATLKVDDGTLGAASGTAVSIKAATFAKDAAAFDASVIIVPQKVAQGTEFVKITLANGTTHVASLGTEVEFATGKVYTFTVTIGSGAEIEQSTSAINWENGGSLSGTTEEKITYGVGDYVTKDGTFIKNADLSDDNKANVAAVIFSTNVSQTDATDGYEAYVMSVKVMGSKSWGFTDVIEGEDGECPTFAEAFNNLDGRTKTSQILESSAYSSLEDKNGSFVNFTNYTNNTNKIENVSSGWFTPSFGQMMQIMNNLGEAGITTSTAITDGNNSSLYTSADNTVINKVNAYVTAVGQNAIFTSGNTYITVTENNALADSHKCWCIQPGESTWSFGKNAGKSGGNRSVIPCAAVKFPTETPAE